MFQKNTILNLPIKPPYKVDDNHMQSIKQYWEPFQCNDNNFRQSIRQETATSN